MKKFILLLLILSSMATPVFADTVWVLCQTDSYVNTRPHPSKKNEPNGYMECGWSAETNGKSKNGFLYLELSNEDGYGWIYKSYIVYSEPIIKTIETNIYADGRVACWRYIGGQRKCWVKPGDSITVYAVSKEWSVTNKGFIKTKYIGVEYETLKLEDHQTEELHWEDD